MRNRNKKFKLAENKLHVITYNDRLNGIKGSTTMKKRESIFKCQARFYNVHSNDDVKHRILHLYIRTICFRHWI